MSRDKYLRPSNAWPTKFVVSFFAALALTACSTSTKMIDQSASPESLQASMKNVMVVAAAKQSEVRRAFEDRMVERLQADGVSASPSYRSLSGDQVSNADSVTRAASQSDAKGVLVLQLTGTEQRQTMPAAEDVAFHAWYSGLYSGPESSAYTDYISQARLFDVNTQKMIWSGTLRTRHPNNLGNDPEKAAKDYAKKVVQALESRGIVKRGS